MHGLGNAPTDEVVGLKSDLPNHLLRLCLYIAVNLFHSFPMVIQYIATYVGLQSVVEVHILAL